MNDPGFDRAAWVAMAIGIGLLGLCAWLVYGDLSAWVVEAKL